MPRRPMALPLALLLPLAMLGCAGCATGPANPSFPLTVREADDALEEMARRPKPLARPVVVVGGYLSVGFGPRLIQRRIRSATGDSRVTTVAMFVAMFTARDMDDCRAQIIAAVDEAFPSTDPDRTTEVDVIGISIGGVAARYAAARYAAARYAAARYAAARPPDDAGKPHRRRLRLARLFTISSPHQGAARAALPTLHELVRQVRPGSAFLAALDAGGHEAGTPGYSYAVYPYVRLGDGVVGPANAAPPGRVAWWVPGRPFEGAHAGAPADPRILADIARRLRGEEPFARDPPAPLPGQP